METDSPPRLPGQYPVTVPIPLHYDAVALPLQTIMFRSDRAGRRVCWGTSFIMPEGVVSSWWGSAFTEQSFWQPLSFQWRLHRRFWPKFRSCTTLWNAQLLRINYHNGNPPGVWQCGLKRERPIRNGRLTEIHQINQYHLLKHFLWFICHLYWNWTIFKKFGGNWEHLQTATIVSSWKQCFQSSFDIAGVMMSPIWLHCTKNTNQQSIPPKSPLNSCVVTFEVSKIA